MDAQPSGRGLGGVQGHRPCPRRRAQPPGMARDPAPVRAQPSCIGLWPIPAFCQLPRRQGPTRRATARRNLRRRPVLGAEPMTAYVAAGVDLIRREGPLVHNVTNLVAMTLSANVLIAAGASPIMSAAPEEAGELAGFSGALVVNI